jgi:nucleoside-diphosphate-sugar epimerase
MKILVTGINSGLGRYIYENMGDFGLKRDTSPTEIETIRSSNIDVIVHCAFNSHRGIDTESFYSYLDDNVFLTKRLMSFEHKKLIFISSVDVYPRGENKHSEENVIKVDSVSGMYGITKLASESIVRRYCQNYLILRTSVLLGKYSGKSSLIKIIENEKCSLTLSGDSKLNCVLYSDIMSFIQFSIENDLQGIFNAVSIDSIVLTEVAEMLNKNVEFGSYCYTTGDIDNSKITSIFPAFKKNSRDVILQFIKERKSE